MGGPLGAIKEELPPSSIEPERGCSSRRYSGRCPRILSSGWAAAPYPGFGFWAGFRPRTMATQINTRHRLIMIVLTRS